MAMIYSQTSNIDGYMSTDFKYHLDTRVYSTVYLSVEKQ